LRFVFKFGGSSLSTVEKIKKVASFIKTVKSRENIDLIIVVSAMGKTTDKLETLAKQVSLNKSAAYSSLICQGENISTFLLTLALEEINVNTVGLTSKDIKIHSRGNPTNSLITHIDKLTIEKHLNKNKVVVISGFQGENGLNQTLTLGRGGSDTTAVALGKVLNAKVKIFTDVKGFFSVNPKLYKSSRFLKQINILSAINLSNTNAKVLDYRCLCLANQNKIPITVCESLKNNGTTITFNPVENYCVDGISVKNKILFVKNTSNKNLFLQKLFQNYDFKYYFYENESSEILASNINKSLLLKIAAINNQILNVKLADILTLTGSGFLIHKDFILNLQKTITKLNITPLYMNITQTCVTIITKQKQGNILEFELGKIFNLIKE